MGKKSKPIIPREATRDEQLKLVADQIYSCAEFWIQACIDSDRMLSEFVWRCNSRGNLLSPPQR